MCWLGVGGWLGGGRDVCVRVGYAGQDGADEGLSGLDWGEVVGAVWGEHLLVRPFCTLSYVSYYIVSLMARTFLVAVQLPVQDRDLHTARKQRRFNDHHITPA